MINTVCEKQAKHRQQQHARAKTNKPGRAQSPPDAVGEKGEDEEAHTKKAPCTRPHVAIAASAHSTGRPPPTLDKKNIRQRCTRFSAKRAELRSSIWFGVKSVLPAAAANSLATASPRRTPSLLRPPPSSMLLMPCAPPKELEQVVAQVSFIAMQSPSSPSTGPTGIFYTDGIIVPMQPITSERL